MVVGAFVMPNSSIHPDTPLTAFSVPLEALESASGPRLPHSWRPSLRCHAARHCSTTARHCILQGDGQCRHGLHSRRSCRWQSLILIQGQDRSFFGDLE